MNCDCPQCKSRSTKAFSVLYRDGQRNSQYTRKGWHYSRRGFGVHGSVTTGQTKTLTSQMAAPPESIVTLLCGSGVVPLALLVAAIAGGSIGFFIALVVAVVLLLFGGSIDAKNHERNLARWKSTFRCGRCGTVFEVKENLGIVTEQVPRGISGPT